MNKLSQTITTTCYNNEVNIFFVGLEYMLREFNIGKTIHEYGLEYLEIQNKYELNDIVNFLNGNKNRSIEEYYTFHRLKQLFEIMKQKNEIKTTIDIEYISGNNSYDFLLTFGDFKIPVEHKYIKKNGNTDAGQCISKLADEISSGDIFKKIVFIIEHDENNTITNFYIESFPINLAVTKNNKFMLNKRTIDKTQNIIKGRWQMTTKTTLWHSDCTTFDEVNNKLKQIYLNTISIE